MTDTNHSRLWKSAELLRSTYFPQLVRAAARQADVPDNHLLLESVAADPDLLAAIVWPSAEGMDATIAQMAADPDEAAVLDARIVAAVNAYQPPTEGA